MMEALKYSDPVIIPRHAYSMTNIKLDGRTGVLVKCDSISGSEREAIDAHPACEFVRVRSQYAPELKLSGFIIWRQPHRAYPRFRPAPMCDTSTN